MVGNWSKREGKLIFFGTTKRGGAPQKLAHFALKTIDFLPFTSGEVDGFSLENILTNIP